MDNFLINMTLATCAGWIMDNLPIIMTLGTPTPTWDARGPPREMGKAYSSHSIGNIAQLRLSLIYAAENGSSIVFQFLSTKMYCNRQFSGQGGQSLLKPMSLLCAKTYINIYHIKPNNT